MVILDKSGQPRDWEWLQATYGPVEIAPAPAGAAYRVVQLTEVDGVMAFHCTLLNAAGGPVAGARVAYQWPDGQQTEITNGSGVAEHTAGKGEAYAPSAGGPIAWQPAGVSAERISGLGWLAGTNHRHLQVTFQLTGSPEQPAAEKPGCLAAFLSWMLERIS